MGNKDPQWEDNKIVEDKVLLNQTFIYEKCIPMVLRVFLKAKHK